jgi:hypothetical protein
MELQPPCQRWAWAAREVVSMLDSKVTGDAVAVLLWLSGIALASFLVSWVLTDVFHVRRGPYVGVLAVVAAGLTIAYLSWSDLGVAFWTQNLAWGLFGAVLTGAILARGVSRISALHAAHRLEAGEGVWEGIVYGTSEGLLLSVLPVVVVWQGFARTSGWSGVVAGAVALSASALVIVVHHLGYREFRNRRIIQPLFACLVLSVGYLLTGSPIAAMGGHIVLHLTMLRRGMELPPHAIAGSPWTKEPAVAA